MFCTKCGKKLHPDYKYLACADCFDAIKEKQIQQMQILNTTSSFVADVAGFSGVSGFCSSGYQQYLDQLQQLNAGQKKQDDESIMLKENPYFEEVERPKRMLRPFEKGQEDIV